jgi:hypothetical protein
MIAATTCAISDRKVPFQRGTATIDCAGLVLLLSRHADLCQDHVSDCSASYHGGGDRRPGAVAGQIEYPALVARGSFSTV